MTTAIVSMKALVNHCPCSGGMPRATLSSGIAIAIVVSLRIATKAATSRSQMTRMPAGSIPSLCCGVTGMLPVSVVTAVLRVCEVLRAHGWPGRSWLRLHTGAELMNTVDDPERLGRGACAGRMRRQQ